MRDFNSNFVQSRLKATNLTYDFLKKNDNDLKYEKGILNSKLRLKMLIALKVNDINHVAEIYPETNSKIFISNLSFQHKFLLWTISKYIYIFIRIYRKYFSKRYQTV